MTLTIRPIQKKETDAVWQMFQHIPSKENEATNHAYGLSRVQFDAFCQQQVAKAQGKGLSADKVPTTMYIIFDEDVPVGFGKFRPHLNATCLQNRAGHCAYMIAPQYRGKGYATAFLSFIKAQAKQLRLSEIEVTSLESNKASCRVIEKNGGKVKKRIAGEVVYVIALS